MVERRALVSIAGQVQEMPAGDTLAGAAGGGGSQEVFVQQTRPAGLGPFAWWQTDATGKIINLTIADGNP